MSSYFLSCTYLPWPQFLFSFWWGRYSLFILILILFRLWRSNRFCLICAWNHSIDLLIDFFTRFIFALKAYLWNFITLFAKWLNILLWRFHKSLIISILMSFLGWLGLFRIGHKVIYSWFFFCFNIIYPISLCFGTGSDWIVFSLFISLMNRDISFSILLGIILRFILDNTLLDQKLVNNWMRLFYWLFGTVITFIRWYIFFGVNRFTNWGSIFPICQNWIVIFVLNLLILFGAVS